MTTDDFLHEKEYIIRRVLHIHFMPKHICGKYRVELDDLMQVGRIALWNASEKFRPKENGLSFDSYAHQLVRLRLLDYLTYLNRQVRQLDYSLSIHSEVLEGVELLDIIPSDTNVEGQVHERLYIESVTSAFTSLEKSIYHLRRIGYSYVEIEKTVGVKGNKLRDIRENMGSKIDHSAKWPKVKQFSQTV